MIGFKRRLASILMSGREDTAIRIALASKFADCYFQARAFPVFGNRRELHDWLMGQMADTAIDYLEFGVFQGASISQIVSANRHPQSRFFGFDSFEGLPEDWNANNPRGMFSTLGSIPDIRDVRVQFVKGWFNQTLPEFVTQFTPHNRLVIHIDSDLYSSALYTMTQLDRFIVPGTLIMFDEFEDLMNEFKAFLDYQKMSGKRFELVASTRPFSQIVVRYAS